MRILVISHKYPPSIGGMERHCFQLVQSLEASPLVSSVHKIIIGENEGKVSFFRKIKKRYKSIISEHPDIDLIYLNDGLMVAFCLWLLKKEIPVLATLHGLDLVFPSDFYQNRIVPKMHQLSGIISVSEATRQQCLKRGFAIDQVINIPNGVDHDIAHRDYDLDILAKVEKTIGIKLTDKKILITLGRPVKRKGFLWFAKEVMTRLPEEYIFLMVGPRNDKKSLTVKLAERLPEGIRHLIEVALSISSEEWELREVAANQDNIVELGKLPFSEVLDLLHMSDAFVMPNVSVLGDAEGFGLVALEAALSETTVIASGIEGITDAIHHGQNGILLESQNTESWVTTIVAQTKDRKQNKLFAKSAKEYTLENFGWDKMAKEYIEYFKKIVDNRL